jgi:pantothenate kinase
MADLPQSVIDRVARLLTYGSRTLLGVAGAPGSGKSTLAMAIQAHFPADTQVVPMDGFHLANVELARLNRAHRKGAADTFDAAGYLNLLQRIKSQRTEEIIYAPEFDRALEEPIAGAIAIKSGTKLLITEGNYLLLEQAPWCSARELFDEVWFVDVDDPLRRERLVPYPFRPHLRRGSSLGGNHRRAQCSPHSANTASGGLGGQLVVNGVNSSIIDRCLTECTPCSVFGG